MQTSDINYIRERYTERFAENGYSPLSLGWGKGKQNLRFHMLLQNFNIKDKSILDIGCGFGDINAYLKQKKICNYYYYGIDIVNEFISEAKERYGNTNVNFECGEFLNKKFDRKFDYVIESGIFNHKMKEMDNYNYINEVMKKAFESCNCALAFDFLSDKADFKKEQAFHSNPTVILNMANNLSSRVILNHSYMPFEFNIVVFKETLVDWEKMCYEMHKNIE